MKQKFVYCAPLALVRGLFKLNEEAWPILE